MYNAKYNPNYMQQRSFGPEFAGIINKFTPRNIQDVVKVLSINPRAKDMVDMIQKYRRDLYESKKMSIKYRDFYKL
jgi:transcriptional regulator with AAA-type ATPase domain